jgi:hypothetical protein
MKPQTKILIAILVLTAIVPVRLAILCFISPGTAISFFEINAVTDEIELLLWMLGCFILATVAFQLFAAWLLTVGKDGGYDLAVISGCIAVARGVLMLVLMKAHHSQDVRIGVVPIIFGTMILIFSVFSGKHRIAS